MHSDIVDVTELSRVSVSAVLVAMATRQIVGHVKVILLPFDFSVETLVPRVPIKHPIRILSQVFRSIIILHTLYNNFSAFVA